MSRQHARYSPSRLGSKEKCSKFDYQQVEQGEVNEAAEEGTLLHSAYETGDLSNLQTDEQRAQVEKTLQYAESLRHGKAMVEFREIKLEIPDYTYGYADHVMIDLVNGEAHVIDCKFGRRGADAADNNVQIMCYAGALLFGKVHVTRFEDVGIPTLKKVTGHIVSPRLDSITVVEYTQEDKARILGRLDKILTNANDPFHAPSPDPDLCTVCQWRAACPAVNKLAVTTTEQLGHFLPSIVDPAQLSTASAVDKSKLYALAQILEAWSEAAKKAVTQNVLQSTDDIPNYSRVKRAGVAKITSTVEAIEMMKGTVPDHVVAAASSLSLSKLADGYSEHSGMSKKDARATIEDMLSPIVERGPDIVFLQRKRGVSEKDVLSSVPQLLGKLEPSPE